MPASLPDCWLKKLDPVPENANYHNLVAEIPWETVENWGSNKKRRVCMMGTSTITTKVEESAEGNNNNSTNPCPPFSVPD